MSITKKVLLYSIIFFVMVGCTKCGRGSSDYASAGELPNVQINSKVWSKYMLKGVRITDDPVLQTTVTVPLPKGFYGILFSSFSLKDAESDAGKELDLVVGWAGPIKNYFDLDIGITYFNFPKMGTFLTGDQIQLQARVSKTFSVGKHALTPYTMMEAVTPFKDDTPKGGIFLHAGVTHSWNIMKRLTLFETASAIYDSGAFGLDDAITGQYTATLSIPICSGFSVDAISIIASVPFTSSKDRDADIAVGSGVTISFSLF